MTACGFGDWVKGVLDVRRERLALDAELHSDLESLLLEEGSRQEDLWGINLISRRGGTGFSRVRFDNRCVRPSLGNRTRGVEDEALRRRIAAMVSKRVKR